jgi:hypothetical protein
MVYVEPPAARPAVNPRYDVPPLPYAPLVDYPPGQQTFYAAFPGGPGFPGPREGGDLTVTSPGLAASHKLFPRPWWIGADAAGAIGSQLWDLWRLLALLQADGFPGILEETLGEGGSGGELINALLTVDKVATQNRLPTTRQMFGPSSAKIVVDELPKDRAAVLAAMGNQHMQTWITMSTLLEKASEGEDRVNREPRLKAWVTYLVRYAGACANMTVYKRRWAAARPPGDRRSNRQRDLEDMVLEKKDRRSVWDVRDVKEQAELYRDTANVTRMMYGTQSGLPVPPLVLSFFEAMLAAELAISGLSLEGDTDTDTSKLRKEPSQIT